MRDYSRTGNRTARDDRKEAIRRTDEQKKRTRDHSKHGKERSTWMVPSETVRHIIGKGGKRKTDIEKTHGTTIHIQDPEPGKHDQRITVTGSRDSVQKTRDALTYIVDTALEDSAKAFTRKQEKAKITCKFYRQGHCKMGQKCNFRHDNGKTPTKRSYSPYSDYTSSSDTDSPSPRPSRRLRLSE